MEYSKKIIKILEEIEVSESNYEKAENRYKNISEYICNSELKKFNPDIFIQGSIKLGTAIKPITEEGSYDIDIVCCFEKLSKNEITQRDLKNQLGKEIINYSKKNNMKNKPKNGKRCWTMTYIDKDNFHIDIMPCIPNNQNSNNIVALTDKRNKEYNIITNNWEISVPRDYYNWFIKISENEKYKKAFAENVKLNIEEIPDYKIKTPLQQIIQILKRHAEIEFSNNMEYKPSSIIITTLVAKTYDNLIKEKKNRNFDELLIEIVKKLKYHINKNENGNPCILNPVNEKENLSLKWEDDVKYFNEFNRWIEKINKDFYLQENVLMGVGESLKIEKSIYDNEKLVKEISHHKKPEWKMVNEKEIKIIVKYEIRGFRERKIESNTPINKNARLKFEINLNNTEKYEIYWQVTNTGNEAQEANCLRGDFYNSHIEKGKKIRREKTAYIGKHYVEAYLVKNGICYGKSEPFVVNIVQELKNPLTM